MRKIIAIMGMAGSGKTEAIEYLVKKYKWPKIYFGEVIFNQMKKKGLVINWKNERFTREKIRREQGMGACAKFSIPKINKALKTSGIVLIESLYSWDEYKIIRKKFKESFYAIAINASPAVRFNRLRRRKIRPIKSFPELVKRDWTEIEGTDKGGPIAIADFTIINEGTVDDLHDGIDKAVKKIIK